MIMMAEHTDNWNDLQRETEKEQYVRASQGSMEGTRKESLQSDAEDREGNGLRQAEFWTVVASWVLGQADRESPSLHSIRQFY